MTSRTIRFGVLLTGIALCLLGVRLKPDAATLRRSDTVEPFRDDFSQLAGTISETIVDNVVSRNSKPVVRSARRVFWVMDIGSAHRGAKGDAPFARSLAHTGARSHALPCQLAQPDRNLFLDRATESPDPERLRVATLEHYLIAFQHRYQGAARPFRWTFTRADFQRLLANLAAVPELVRPAA